MQPEFPICFFQGVGLFLGCAIMDVKLASNLVMMFVLFSNY